MAWNNNSSSQKQIKGPRRKKLRRSVSVTTWENRNGSELMSPSWLDCNQDEVSKPYHYGANSNVPVFGEANVRAFGNTHNYVPTRHPNWAPNFSSR
jgi:hypothetical protein